MGIKSTIGHGRRSARVAATLWLVLAFVVWNVVFDRVLVLAGRRYLHVAALSVREERGYVRIDDWMRPATEYGVRVATVAALAIAVFGLIAVALASRADRRRGSTHDRKRLQPDLTRD